MILIRGGLVMTPTGMEEASVMIEADKVVAVGPDLAAGEGTRVLDVPGAWVGPGLVDVHVHLREPGQTWKEDLQSGSAAARAGGFTAVVAMPNTDPPLDGGGPLELALHAARRVEGLELRFAGALSVGRRGEEMADVDALYDRGVRIFTDDGDSPQDAALMRMVMKYLADLPGAVVADHAEDAPLSRGGQLHAGRVSTLLGVPGIPSSAEEVAVARDLALAAETGARLHLQHLSTAGAVDSVRRAKAVGLQVTAEVTPHHLVLDESAVESLDPNAKMYPPLRSEDDRAALVAGLRDGTIDCVATDHAPHAPHEKGVPFEEAPRGVIGLETAASLVSGVLTDPATFFTRMSVAPAALAGLADQGRPVAPGSPANLVVFDPGRRWSPSRFLSKASNSPFLGTEMVGRVVATVHRGRIVHEVAV